MVEGHWTRDVEVVHLIALFLLSYCDLRQVVYTHVPLFTMHYVGQWYDKAGKISIDPSDSIGNRLLCLWVYWSTFLRTTLDDGIAYCSSTYFYLDITVFKQIYMYIQYLYSVFVCSLPNVWQSVDFRLLFRMYKMVSRFILGRAREMCCWFLFFFMFLLTELLSVITWRH